MWPQRVSMERDQSTLTSSTCEFDEAEPSKRIEYKQVVLDDKVIVPLPSIPIKQFSSTHQSLSKCLGCKIPPPHRRNAFPIAFVPP